MRPQLNINLKVVGMVIAIIVASFYLFPIGFRGIPESLNTKQILAVLGVAVFGLKCVWERSLYLSRYTMATFAMACVFSVWCFFSTVINNTVDYSYATYIRSFVIWLGGAYSVCLVIQWAYGELTIRNLTRVLAMVCVLQCISALLVDNMDSFQRFVDKWIIQDDMPKRVKRMYGMGISLDSGAVRLDMVLMLIAYQLGNRTETSHSKLSVWTYVIAFIFICLVGSMIARTTWVGMGMGLAYIFCMRMKLRYREFSRRRIMFFFMIIGLLFTIVIYLTYMYQTNPVFREYMRFGFEAFFNFFEHGEFRTDSTDRLNDVMWIWPTEWRGWLIGYGKFDYSQWGHFTTDIGYCRFVLYCGLIGMAIFSVYFIYLATVVARKYENATLFAILLGCLSFIIWIKVSTDLFQLYALLLCLPATKGITAESSK